MNERFTLEEAELLQARLAGARPDHVLTLLAPVFARWIRDGAFHAAAAQKNLLDLTGRTYPGMVRVAAVDALGVSESRAPVVLERLRQLLSDEDACVRASAGDALENLGAQP